MWRSWGKFDDEEGIAIVFNNFFQDIFSTSHPERITEAVQVVKDRLSDAMHNIVEAEFTENEVFLAVKNIKPHAALEPDGMPALFYQQFWSIVGKDVTSFALKILNGGGNPSNIQLFNNWMTMIFRREFKDFSNVTCGTIRVNLTKTKQTRFS
jgi:hypothetical protein